MDYQALATVFDTWFSNSKKYTDFDQVSVAAQEFLDLLDLDDGNAHYDLLAAWDEL
jgi:hypothetical protein